MGGAPEWVVVSSRKWGKWLSAEGGCWWMRAAAVVGVGCAAAGAAVNGAAVEAAVVLGAAAEVAAARSCGAARR